MKAKRFKRISLVAILVLLFSISLYTFLNSAYCCSHESTSVNVVKEATCFEEGTEEVVCDKCGTIMETRSVPMLEHIWGEYTIVSEPSERSTNGVMVRRCTLCNKADTQIYECPHDETNAVVVKEATCGEEGREDVVCSQCHAVVDSRTLEKLPHEKVTAKIVKKPSCTSTGLEKTICNKCGEVLAETELKMRDHDFGDWEYVKQATPFEEGEKSRSCSMCGKTETQTYDVDMSNHSIYIEGTGVFGDITVAGTSQDSVNSYDMTYGDYLLDYYGPWLLGHKTGTFSHLSETKVGTNVYLSLNGEFKTYEVIVSEYAEQNEDWTDIICQSSGHSIFDDFGGEVLKMYTCYGGDGGRWVVIAKLVDSTFVE